MDESQQRSTDAYRRVQLYFECSVEMTEFILQMCRDTNFADAGVTFSHKRVIERSRLGLRTWEWTRTP